jgi:hypothetical protein
MWDTVPGSETRLLHNLVLPLGKRLFQVNVWCSRQQHMHMWKRGSSFFGQCLLTEKLQTQKGPQSPNKQHSNLHAWCLMIGPCNGDVCLWVLCIFISCISQTPQVRNAERSEQVILCQGKVGAQSFLPLWVSQERVKWTGTALVPTRKGAAFHSPWQLSLCSTGCSPSHQCSHLGEPWTPLHPQ